MRLGQFITLSVFCRVVALVIALVLSACANAPRFNTTDKVLQSGVAASFALDYTQTRKIVRDGLERNPLMGRCGGHVQVEGADCTAVMSPEVYFLGVFAVHTAVMHALPRPWRNAAQGLTIGVQSRSIERNYQAGYGFTF